MILAGKRLLITGVITKDSIAFHAAEHAQREGASVVLTSFGRVRRLTERAAQRLPEAADVLELDVNEEDDLEAVASDLRERWGGVDGVLHAIAFAPEDAIGGRFMTAPPESAVVLCVMLPNAANFGMSASLLAFGREGLMQASLYFITFSILTYTVGVLTDLTGPAASGLFTASRRFDTTTGCRSSSMLMTRAAPTGSFAL